MTKDVGFDWRSITPDDSPMSPMDLFESEQHKNLATPDVTVGGPAFDFELPVYDFSTGVERATGESMRLLDVATHRPVALIFGSYT